VSYAIADWSGEMPIYESLRLRAMQRLTKTGEAPAPPDP
jgi:hypothetical protein